MDLDGAEPMGPCLFVLGLPIRREMLFAMVGSVGRRNKLSVEVFTVLRGSSGFLRLGLLEYLFSPEWWTALWSDLSASGVMPGRIIGHADEMCGILEQLL